jgi:hypothetical protein
MNARVGDLSSMTVEELAAMFGGADAIVFSAGSNGGSREVTKAIDGEGVEKSIAAARLAGVERFALISVLPESWRERDLGEEVEYYFAVKKDADIALSRSELNWPTLRPSLLIDGPGAGAVSLGPAEFHGQITRDNCQHPRRNCSTSPASVGRSSNSTRVQHRSKRRSERMFANQGVSCRSWSSQMSVLARCA